MRESIDYGGAAFPFQQDSIAAEPGMSLRDWFAGQALNGLCACPNLRDTKIGSIVSQSFEFADAMIAARKRQPSPE